MPRMPPTVRGVRSGEPSYDQRRRRVKASRRWYGLKAWSDRRRDQLAREPLCKMHLDRNGEHVPATVADHVEPHREDPERFWHGELQSLCATCHSSIKQREETREGVGQFPIPSAR